MLDRVRMGWVWFAVFVIVAIFGFGYTPWETIQHALENQGSGDEGNTMIAFVAGYTLPLTLGFSILAFIALVQEESGTNLPGPVWFVIAGFILAFCGLLAQVFGLGLIPDYESRDLYIAGPIYTKLLTFVLGAYFNTYGFGLMLCAFAIGCAAAMHVYKFLDSRLS